MSGKLFARSTLGIKRRFNPRGGQLRSGGAYDKIFRPGMEQTSAYSGPGLLTTLFVLAVLGFGAKAGLAPLHIWLPEAHPAAPSHISALLSGAMINAGFYGILRSVGMGILALGIGVGGVAVPGAMLHAVCHSLTKCMPDLSYLPKVEYQSVEDINGREAKDAEVLMAICKNVVTTAVLEIGTSTGLTTLGLAHNAPHVDG